MMDNKKCCDSCDNCSSCGQGCSSHGDKLSCCKEHKMTKEHLMNKKEFLEEKLKCVKEEAISWCEMAGIQVLMCMGNHHRKLALLDRKVLWEGSLNILSQTYSREIMRRIESPKLTMQMFNFLKLEKFL